MNRIESRPSRRGMWDYVFFIDLDGHAQDEPVASTLTELREQASLFRVLGSYPKGCFEVDWRGRHLVSLDEGIGVWRRDDLNAAVPHCLGTSSDLQAQGTHSPCPRFLSSLLPGVRTLQPYQPGKPESELRREYGLSDIVKLASNENPLGPSPKAMTAVRKRSNDLARYPDGNGFELKAALSAKLGISMSMLTLGNGSNDVLELVARAFLTPEHEAIFSEHAFAVYPIVTQAIGATARVAKANRPDHAMPMVTIRRLCWRCLVSGLG